MKTNTSEPRELWQTTYYWLQLSGNKPNMKFCREDITSHPDYPAMTAITDFLDAGNMEYQAVEARLYYPNYTLSGVIYSFSFCFTSYKTINKSKQN